VFQRILFTLLAVLALSAGRADAITVRDVIELSKAGLGDSVLLTLIEVDRTVFAIDTTTLKQLKEAGVSDTVILAMIKSGREVPPPAAPAQDPAPAVAQPEPPIVVIDHHDAPAPQPVYYPVAVPVYIPYVPYSAGTVAAHRGNDTTVKATIATDQGLFKARVPVPPNCVKAEPVYWGFGGKLRPGSWEPPPTVVCR
jgi:hypothetical protein